MTADNEREVQALIQAALASLPIQLKVPRLPALPFFDRAYFPWLPQLEAATEAIRGEVLALLEAGLPGFAPYIQYAPYSGQDCQR